MHAHDEYDVVDLLLLPVFMIQQSIELIETVVSTAKDITKANSDAFIVNLISIMLILVGGLGAAFGTTTMRVLGCTLLCLAEAGNAGIGIYAAVGTPESTPLLIFGLVLSGKGSQGGQPQTDYDLRRYATFNEAAAKQMAQVARWNKKTTTWANVSVCVKL